MWSDIKSPDTREASFCNENTETVEKGRRERMSQRGGEEEEQERGQEMGGIGSVSYRGGTPKNSDPPPKLTISHPKHFVNCQLLAKVYNKNNNPDRGKGRESER